MTILAGKIEPMGTMTAEHSLIEIDRVRKSFGAHTAIDNVSLALGEGHFVTLLGPSGCGKTTLLRMIGGLETPNSGSIRIAGTPVESFSPIDRPTRMVFQSYALFPHMTVEKNVAYGLQRRRIPDAEIKAKVAAQLDVVGLSEKAKSYPSELSGGQQQRVALARALVTKPRVLLLDEPLAALDLKLRQRMQAELKSLQRSAAITFVYVTHDQHEALGLSDRVVVMEKGRVAQRGTPAEIYHRPANRYVAEFVGDISILDGTVRTIEDGGARIETPAGMFVASGPTVRSGDKVHAIIRPESVRVAVASGDGANTLRATVESATFRGADMLVEFRGPADVRIQTSISSTAPEAAAIIPGHTITLELPATALWLIPAERNSNASESSP
ncbi:ABC transporter ATP-binding protein [Hyphomicrobium sp. CS1BSMeth3]|uniref:ABC transporter ATP-binding protein n=1 Tax=Hyphomicrobium sp. CS1BSMeth3 TaxID=1892844 RepID=UPI000930BF6B|nr:ABC transporter ATP-binding protein [Hyphomicrobium sp. CS1BSMeth3]